MHTRIYTSLLPANAETVFAWHEQAGAFVRLTPPWTDVKLHHFEGVQNGARAVFEVGPGPVSIKWIAEHRDYVKGKQFRDVQLQGPFRRWEHLHLVEPAGKHTSRLVDQLVYELPLGGIGQIVTGQVDHQIDRMFTYRHRILRQDLSLHAQYGREKLKVAITGASGLIGSSLTAFLSSGGHEVYRLVRSRPVEGRKEIYWNPRHGEIDAKRLEGFDAVIHLAGENIFALRWSESKKKRILSSRIRGTELLSKTLSQLDRPPQVLISSSAVGSYGDRGDEVLTERSALGSTGFLPVVCRAWETATQPAVEAGIRTVQIRTGIVLSPRAGALQLMLPVFQLGLGGRIGAGRQYMSWIALDDVFGGIYHIMATDSLHGPVNLVSPNPLTMSAFVKVLGHVLARPVWFQVPTSMVRTAMGEVADETAILSTRAIPQRLTDTGYSFLYPELEAALRHALGRYQRDEYLNITNVDNTRVEESS